MLNKLKKLNSERQASHGGAGGGGFTIIEVMIVLAIAGLIILIVLLAVPALQRNSRNTAIKNDASAIVAGVSEFASNNDGAIPTAPPSSKAAGSSTVTLSSSVGSPTAATAKVQGSTAVTFTGTPSGAGTIVVRFGQKCTNSTSFGLTPSQRSTAVLYNIEGSGGTVAPRCIDS